MLCSGSFTRAVDHFRLVIDGDDRCAARSTSSVYSIILCVMQRAMHVLWDVCLSVNGGRWRSCRAARFYSSSSSPRGVSCDKRW